MTYIPLTRRNNVDQTEGHARSAFPQRAQTSPKRPSEASAPSATSVSSVVSAPSVERLDAITRALPNERITDDTDFRHGVFRLCRELRGEHAVALPDQLRPLVEQWWENARRFLPGRTWVDVWSEFLAGWPKVRRAAGEDQIALSWQAANALPPLPEAARYDDPRIGKLMTLCSQLQKANGGAAFFLNGRKVAELFGVSHPVAGKWLNMLVQDGVLEVIDRGGGIKAGRRMARSYRFADQ